MNIRFVQIQSLLCIGIICCINQSVRAAATPKGRCTMRFAKELKRVPEPECNDAVRWIVCKPTVKERLNILSEAVKEGQIEGLDLFGIFDVHELRELGEAFHAGLHRLLRLWTMNGAHRIDFFAYYLPYFLLRSDTTFDRFPEYIDYEIRICLSRSVRTIFQNRASNIEFCKVFDPVESTCDIIKNFDFSLAGTADRIDTPCLTRMREIAMVCLEGDRESLPLTLQGMSRLCEDCDRELYSH